MEKFLHLELKSFEYNQRVIVEKILKIGNIKIQHAI
jgi:hypothetical protein